MTMPSLIEKHKVKSTVSRLKKVHSLLEQAYILAKQEYGEFEDWYDLPKDTFLLYEYDYSVQGLQRFAKYMKPIKLCTDKKSCNQSGRTYYLNGTTNFFLDVTYPSMILSDGTIIYYVNYHSECGVSTTSKNKRSCGTFYVDINGKKGPNKWGYDLFAFKTAQDVNKAYLVGPTDYPVEKGGMTTQEMLEEMNK